MGLVIKYSEAKAVPEGMYVVKLTKLEPQTHAQWGEGIKWNFEITEGEHAGVNITAISSTKVSPKSKIFSWVQSFGITLEAGQEFDLEELIGRVVHAKVQNKSTSKMVDGRSVEMTFSNVVDVGPYHAPATPQPSEEGATPSEAVPAEPADDELNF